VTAADVETGADVVSFLHQAALTYARNGVAVFPCQPRGKQPATGRGFHDATTDADQVDRWWRDQPDANIGVALGQSGVWLLDVDGPEAQAALDQLVDEHGPLPDTYSITTGRDEGGRHLMFRQPAHGSFVRNRKLAAGGHLEVRGDGGYAIAPPSVHPSGRSYIARGKWPDIVDPPQWLVDLCRPTTTTQTEGWSPPTKADTPAEAAALGAAGRVAMGTEGNRNDLLYWAACRCGELVAAGRLDLDWTVQLLQGAGGRSGLPPREVDATVQSGLTEGAKSPDHGNPFDDQPAPPVTVIDDHGTTQATPPAPRTAEADVPVPLDPADLDADNPLHRAVLDQYIALVARRHAVQIDIAATTPPPPELTSLTDLLAEPDPDVVYRLDGLWPQHGRVMLAAQFKAGKTTLVGNVTRSLVDQVPFLGAHEPAPLDGGRVVVIDDELHQDTLRRWYRDFTIVNTDLVDVVCLRGRTSTFNILDPHVRKQWADKIAAANATVVVFDCLRPVLDALGLSEDKDAGRFLVAFDELLMQAGVTEALVVHHMGHEAERARGDSRLRDWPDVEWRLIRDGNDDDPAAQRYFAAYGRDVDQPERRLDFDLATRDLQAVGGSRRDDKTLGVLLSICTAVEQTPGLSMNALRSVTGWGYSKARKAVDLTLDKGLVEDRSPASAQGIQLHRTTKEIG